MANGRYVIIVRSGQKIMQRHYFNSYDQALDMLEFIEDNGHKLYSTKISVEFKDTNPFDKG